MINMAKRATTLGDKCLVVWLYGRVPILGVFGHFSLVTGAATAAPWKEG